MAKKTAKKVAAGKPNKPTRKGGANVSFGVHGLASIVNAVSDAGLEDEFNKALGQNGKFVTVPRTSLAKIKTFVASKPELAGFADQMEKCDCDPSDPYCIYI